MYNDWIFDAFEIRIIYNIINLFRFRKFEKKNSYTWMICVDYLIWHFQNETIDLRMWIKIAKHTNWKQWWNFDYLSRKKKNVINKSYKSSKIRIYWTICEMNVLILFEIFRLIVQNVRFNRSTKYVNCAINENFVLF